MAIQKKTRRDLQRAKNEIKRLSKDKQIHIDKAESYQNAINIQVALKKELLEEYKKGNISRERLDSINAKINALGKEIRTSRDKVRENTDAIAGHKAYVRSPRISKLVKSRNNGYFVKNDIYPLIPLSEISIDKCEQLVRKKYSVAQKMLNDKIKFTDSTIKNIRLVFCDEYGDFITSKNLTSLQQVKQALITEMNKHTPTTAKGEKIVGSEGIRCLMAIDFFMFNLKNKGGCSNREKTHIIFNLSHNELLRIYCPKSSDNRCFDMCLKKATHSKVNSVLNRRQLNIPKNKKINPSSNDAHLIADSLGVNSYVVYQGIVKPNRIPNDSIDLSLKKICEYGKQNGKIVRLILIAGHFYLIRDNYIYKRKCKNCGKEYARGMPITHKCDKYNVSYYQKMICKNNVMPSYKLRTDKCKNWVFFDLETLPCGVGQSHSVYAVGWYNYATETYHHSYGRDSMQQFMDWINTHNDKTYIAYNGSKFDFYFLQNMLIQQNTIPQYLMTNGRLLSLKWNKNRVWDLYNFMPSFSLSDACDAFNTKYKKSTFDHSKMKNWNSVRWYKDEVLPYLELDVMSLCELTEKFVDTCEDLYTASPTMYLTLSSYAEKVWQSFNDNIIELPDMDKQRFIGLSVYGGRTYPCRKKYESKYLKTIHNNKSNVNKLKQIYKLCKESNDYIFNGDINSQYPACMAGCDLLNAHYPSGLSKWIDDIDECEKIFLDKNKLGIFEIEFKCPNKKILHPILPRKKIITRQNGANVFTGIEWTLNDGKGVYNTIDIQNAIKHGYVIKFTGKGLYWNTKSNKIFDTYINLVYSQKVNATNQNNNVKRQIAKLMMNSLYGKTLQRPIASVECIAKNLHTVEQFISENIITDWVTVENNNNQVEYIILTGEKINQYKITKKPRHLGSFVLAYSRRLWLKFIETIDPTLTTQITTYLDTDSLRISGEHYNILVENGLIDNNALGYLSNDCKNDAIIIREINISPKCYMYETLDKDGNLKTIMKSKGIIKDYLQSEWYDNNKSVEVCWNGLKKINKRVSKADKENGIKPFSIKSQEYKRTFNKNEWNGMTSDDNYFYPFGYEKIN